MKGYPIWHAQIIDGKICYENLVEFQRYIDLLKQQGGKIDIIYRKHSAQRSLDQNSYYWGVVIPLIQEWNGDNDPQDTHRGLCGVFLVDRTKKLPSVKGSSTLSTIEFCEFIDKIVAWAAMEANIVIPPPINVGI